MKLTKVTAIFTFAMFVLGGAQLGYGAPKKKAKAKQTISTVEGMLTQAKNKKGKVIAAAIKTADGSSVSISLDKMGKKLSAQFDGKKVTASGVLFSKKVKKVTTKWIRLKEVKEVVEKASNEAPEGEESEFVEDEN